MEAAATKSPNEHSLDPGKIIAYGLAILFFVACSWASYARWANFQYRTFDLAYYVQAIWQLIHGRFEVSVENVPLLGNHVEPIVFLFVPLFALFRHPMVFVVVQNAALSAMAPIGYKIARRLGFGDLRSGLLGAALLLAPAAGFIALHEFHPEALAAPFLLLMIQARLEGSVKRHWLWFIAVLACKENMALLLIAYGAVQLVVDRKQGWIALRNWYVLPMALAIVWLVVCTQLITPALNAGAIDYLALYDRLGRSPVDILEKAIAHPSGIGQAIYQSLRHGNLLWGLLLPFLFLPLLRPRWLLIAAPVLLQHLLSWRSSEWMIYFHYAAPLLPIFWIAMVEALSARGEHRSFVLSRAAWLVAIACIISQLWLGPARQIGPATIDFFGHRADRLRKEAFIDKIPSQASVVAPLPYLSHLAMREKLYSLHYILKGLKTLSRDVYQPPPPPDFVAIDYLDSATFDASAGYYHPSMRTVDGRIIPSSDRLLHDFLKRAQWTLDSRNELTLMHKLGALVDKTSEKADDAHPPLLAIGDHTVLLAAEKSGAILSPIDLLEIRLRWRFSGEREVIPWMLLRLSQGDKSVTLSKGLCAPEMVDGTQAETWRLIAPPGLPVGDYTAEALFIDNSKRAWFETTGGSEAEATLLAEPVRLGQIRVR